MAKGKTHDKITIALSPLIVIIFLMINVNLFENKSQIVIVTVLAVSIYLFGGFMFSGDLDIKSMEYYRWGKLKFIWNPYQSMFKHRSIFTHGFLLGPIIRVI
ncbi:metal-binding protein [Clostridium chauvoei]|nr:metal-binding protein [Clostridium chauvoei]